MIAIASNQTKIQNNLSFKVKETLDRQRKWVLTAEIEYILISSHPDSGKICFQSVLFSSRTFITVPAYSFRFSIWRIGPNFMYISRANEHSMINSGICIPSQKLPFPNNISVEFEFQCVLQILNCQSFSIMEIITRRILVEHLNFAGGILFSDKRTLRRINITISYCSSCSSLAFPVSTRKFRIFYAKKLHSDKPH